MKIAAVSIALLSASKSVDARIGSKAAMPFFKLIQDDEACKAKAEAAGEKCTQVKADGCGDCAFNAPKEDYGLDEAKKCITLPACVKKDCDGCEDEVKEVYNCVWKAGGLDYTACAGENASFDFAAALRSNFLQGQDDEECKAETDAMIAKCTQVNADGCGKCFDNAKKTDYSFDKDKMCLNLPDCVKDECNECLPEIKEAYNCHLAPHGVCAADFAAVSAVF